MSDYALNLLRDELRKEDALFLRNKTASEKADKGNNREIQIQYRQLLRNSILKVESLKRAISLLPWPR